LTLVDYSNARFLSRPSPGPVADEALRDRLLAALDGPQRNSWEGLSERRQARLLDVARNRMPGALLALDEVSSPHNQAAVLRSADGLGFTAVALSGPTPFAPNPEVALGAEGWVALRRFTDSSAMITALHAEGLQVLASDLDTGARPLSAIDLTHPAVLLFGNEHKGLSAATVAAADGAFFLPMTGFAQSYNVSVAAALGGYELRRQREAAGVNLRLPEAEAVTLIRSWLDRMAAELALSRGLAGKLPPVPETLK
jgi:tRNA (guanosine-2'-O-)-methyltransferase